MARKLFTLILNVQASVRQSDERFDFEPLSWWIPEEDGSSNIHQRVYREGSYLVGESGRYRESLEDVVSDFDRFVSLTAIR